MARRKKRRTTRRRTARRNSSRRKRPTRRRRRRSYTVGGSRRGKLNFGDMAFASLGGAAGILAANFIARAVGEKIDPKFAVPIGSGGAIIAASLLKKNIGAPAAHGVMAGAGVPLVIAVANMLGVQQVSQNMYPPPELLAGDDEVELTLEEAAQLPHMVRQMYPQSSLAGPSNADPLGGPSNADPLGGGYEPPLPENKAGFSAGYEYSY